eukprot:gene44883-54899_t
MTPYSTSDFDSSKLPFVGPNTRWVTIEVHNRLFSLLKSFIIANATGPVPSMKVGVLPSKGASENNMGNLTFGRINFDMGYGLCQFRSFDGDIYHALYQQLGKPVGTGCGVDIYKSLVVFTENSIEKLGEFFTKLVEMSEKTDDGKFICYTWHIDHAYWREETKITTRPLQSVVLPAAMKERLVNDVEKFLSPRTKDFYIRNGIPYRRSYLFWG